MTWQLRAVLGAWLALISAAGAGGLLLQTEVTEARVDCSQTHILRVLIGYEETGAGIAFAGSRVEITPDPRDGAGSRTYVDNGDFDDEALSGFVIEDTACRLDGDEPAPAAYRVRLLSLPADCEVVSDATQSTVLVRHVTLQFDVTGCRVPEVTVTGAESSLGCSESSAVVVRVTLDGRPVADGALVRIWANRGRVDPFYGMTQQGDAFATYRAPS